MSEAARTLTRLWDRPANRLAGLGGSLGRLREQRSSLWRPMGIT